MSSSTRRRFLTRSIQAAAAIGLSAELAPLWAAAEARGFKIGACDWSLGKTAAPAAFDVAKEIGLDGVQVSLGRAKNDMHLRKPEVQKAYQAKLEATGLEIALAGHRRDEPRAAEERSARGGVAPGQHRRLQGPGHHARHARVLRQGRPRHGEDRRDRHVVKVLKDAAAKAEKAR